jgi:hypothetical protein
LEIAMFESLESREFMSVTLPTIDALTSDAAAAQPTTSVDVTTESKTAKPKPSSFSFTHLYDKSSPVLSM